jgi:hypothetical protein
LFDESECYFSSGEYIGFQNETATGINIYAHANQTLEKKT